MEDLSRKTLSIQDIVFRAQSQMILMWADQDSSGVRWIPRSLTRVDGEIVVPFSVMYWKNCDWNGSSCMSFEVFVVWQSSSNFSSWSIILFCSDQYVAFVRSSCNKSTSWEVDMDFRILVSSAKLLATEWTMQEFRSFKYRIKSTGPSTVPWGTPLITGEGSDLWPSTTTVWIRLLRYAVSQLWIFAFYTI